MEDKGVCEGGERWRLGGKRREGIGLAGSS